MKYLLNMIRCIWEHEYVDGTLMGHFGDYSVKVCKRCGRWTSR